MANRDLIYGALITALTSMTIQDYYGLEGYIEHVRNNWTTVSFPVSATVTALVWLMYMNGRRKTQRIVVKPGMEQVLSLQEGDIVTIEKRS
jgi:hypothetical protein